MADLKPLGSEKLKGDEKMKRILELTYYKGNDKNLTESRHAELIVESVNCVYGIVKENNDYFVKKGLTEDKLDYIGGMFMKNKNKFSSYSEALKRLELLKGQEELLSEDKKYVLKVNKPKASAPAPAAEAPIDTPPIPDAGGGVGEPKMPANLPNLADMADDLPPEDEALDSGGEPEGEEEGYLKEIQKLTGKLGEKLRDFEGEITSEDIKYVVNSVLSAIDLEKLEETDKDEILTQFESSEVGDEMGDEVGDDLGPEMGDDAVPPPDFDDEEITEEDPLQKVVDMEFDFSDDPVEGLDDFERQFDEDNLEFDTEIPLANDNEIEICSTCKGTGVKNGEECTVCNGEGTILPNNDEEEEVDVDLATKKRITIDDLIDDDDDLGYDPIEMGETDEVPSDLPDEIYNDEVNDVVSQEIELDELTNTINQSVKETLGKYFE